VAGTPYTALQSPQNFSLCSDGNDVTMENKKTWYDNLSQEEKELADSYRTQIESLIKDLPKDASQEQRNENLKKQKYIFDQKLEPLMVLSHSRKLGITPGDYKVRLEKIKNIHRFTIKQKVALVFLLAILSAGVLIVALG
jgi:ribonucleotide reductase beta subunit family protein with ferritin-like domain